MEHVVLICPEDVFCGRIAWGINLCANVAGNIVTVSTLISVSNGDYIFRPKWYVFMWISKGYFTLPDRAETNTYKTGTWYILLTTTNTNKHVRMYVMVCIYQAPIRIMHTNTPESTSLPVVTYDTYEYIYMTRILILRTHIIHMCFVFFHTPSSGGSNRRTHRSDLRTEPLHERMQPLHEMMKPLHEKMNTVTRGWNGYYWTVTWGEWTLRERTKPPYAREDRIVTWEDATVTWGQNSSYMKKAINYTVHQNASGERVENTKVLEIIPIYIPGNIDVYSIVPSCRCSKTSLSALSKASRVRFSRSVTSASSTSFLDCDTPESDSCSHPQKKKKEKKKKKSRSRSKSRGNSKKKASRSKKQKQNANKKKQKDWERDQTQQQQKQQQQQQQPVQRVGSVLASICTCIYISYVHLLLSIVIAGVRRL